jgi:anti-sigma factor RsiW
MDGQLSEADKNRLERRLKTEPALRETLAGLRATVRAMRSLPQVKVPRNFVLDPKVYSAQRPARASGGFYGILRFGTAVATALFVVSLAGDFLTRSGRQFLAAPQPAEAPAMAEQLQAPTDTPGLAEFAAPAEEAEATALGGSPTPPTGVFLEGPGTGGGGEPPVGGAGGGEPEQAAPAPDLATAQASGEDSRLAETGTPEAALLAAEMDGSETPAAEATPAGSPKAAETETPTPQAQADVPPEAPPETRQAQPEAVVPAAQPVDWLRAAQIVFGALAVGLGLAALWHRSRGGL